MKARIDLDRRFQDVTADQRNADRHLYRWDRRRGWAISDARSYINAVIDHQVAHEQERGTA
jgi:hypothetical protein